METESWSFFLKNRQETWHSFEGDGHSDRIALVYNLVTTQIKKYLRLKIKIFNWVFKI